MKKAAHKGDVHKKQHNRIGKIINDTRFAGEIIVNKRPCRDQEIHRVDTGHTVFKILLEPVFGQMEIIIISESDQEAGEHEKDGYPDVKLKKETLDEMREIFIKGIFVVRDEHEVCC